MAANTEAKSQSTTAKKISGPVSRRQMVMCLTTSQAGGKESQFQLSQWWSCWLAFGDFSSYGRRNQGVRSDMSYDFDTNYEVGKTLVVENVN